ncbi:adhesion G protein-coupled receptor L3-like isoform X2 [Daphnia carinata]|uniref:adhesion G protein-coupled receptor L3-like isoform X2 n=1 Tax=Daphnia carinata TaxID=120202 RepID=UPI00257C0194|nr:adhesion G protein-coupled receptor L3-like isoform X2 [Daphnia carinata]
MKSWRPLESRGTSYQVRASNCVATDGSCTWTEPFTCKSPKTFCTAEAECLVVTKSINSSYPLESVANQQFQCRCLSGNSGTCKPYQFDATFSVQLDCTTLDSTNSSLIIPPPLLPKLSTIVYAEMWRCPAEENTIIQCSTGRASITDDYKCKGVPQLLPNVLALVRFWCQYKVTDCRFDSSLILSHTGKPTTSPSLPNSFVFELERATYDATLFGCGDSSLSTLEGDSCYRLTPVNLEWQDARSYCLQLGGDLAHFTSLINFASILRRLDNSIPSNITASSAIPIWFKWYIWTGEQRTPQHYMEYTSAFQCAVYDFVLPADGINPQADCFIGTKTRKVRGLCVLSPSVASENFEYEQLFCPATCGVTGYPPDFCWEETLADTQVIKNCPSNYKGEASWFCGPDGQWATPSPNLSNCSNPIVEDSINQANNEITNGDNPSGALKSLTSVVETNEIASGNIIQIQQTVVLAIDKQNTLIANDPDPVSRDATTKNFTNSVVDLSDVVMNSTLAFWGLEINDRAEAVNQIQTSVDDTLLLLAENLLDDIYLYTGGSSQNLAIQVENIAQENYDNETYVYVVGANDQLTLPVEFLNATNETNTTLSFATYSAFQDILHGDTLAQLFDENQTALVPIRQVVVSRAIGATIGEPNGSIYFVDGKVEILLSTLNRNLYEVNATSATCAYWNTSTQDWSFDGCEVIYADDVSTICQCDHLTNFAVLMDINGLFQNTTILALDYITVVGESISIVCLVVVILIFSWVRTLRRDFRFTIHRNLCWNLLIAEILLLAGIDATYNPDLCLSIAVFLHLFFLCAFSWMFIEGLYMWLLLVKVFPGTGLKRWQYYLIGYGLPVLVVVITLAATSTEAYNNSSYCWLSYANGAIWAFAAPVLVVVLVNSVFLVAALRITFKTRHATSGNTDNHRWVLGTVSLTFILGITWLFGFLFFGQELGQGIAFAYIFTILNSLQGFFIFISFCFLNKKVRTDLHRQIVNHPTYQRVSENFSFDWSALFARLSLTTMDRYNVMETTNSTLSNSQSTVQSIQLYTTDSSML